MIKLGQKIAVNSRIMIVASAIMLNLFLARLIHLQILQGQEFLALAEENRLFREPIPAPRGLILDRYGQPLVNNLKFYFQAETEDILFAQREPISRSQALRLMATGSAQVSYELRRSYQYPWIFSHVLGYTAPVSKQDLLESDELAVTDWVGRMGVEQSWQNLLRGSAGYKLYEINTLGEKQRLIDWQEPVAGKNIQTSLDPYLSQVAYQALGQQQGSVVILDGTSGEVLTLVNKPGFDANDLSYSRTDSKLEEQRQQNLMTYLQDEAQPFFNRAVAGAYPPGSVFKLVTALAGLRQDKLSEQTTVVDEGILRVGDYEYANWYFTQYGRTEGEIGLVRAIARSNDIFFYKAAEWTGVEALAQQARELGLGQPTGIELPGEVSGLVPDPAWKEQQLGERWYLGNTYHMGIGQGDILVSPLQIGQMVQAVSNQGRLCQPHLRIQTGTEQDNKNATNGQCRNLGLDQTDLDIVLRGMIQACSSGGTAYPLFKFNQTNQDDDSGSMAAAGLGQQAVDNGWVACKTGTAEFGGLDEQGYRQTHGWLAAVFGLKTQQLAAEAKEAVEAKNRSDKDAGSSLNPSLDTAGVSSVSKTVKDQAAPENQEPDYSAIVDENREKSPNQLRQDWLVKAAEHGFPQRLVVVVLVESDDMEPYKEGSEHAGPVVAQILDWVQGNFSEESAQQFE